MIEFNLDNLASKKRRDCLDGERPCPWVRCRHHMIWFIHQVHKKSNDEIVELIFTLPETCTLDVADSGGKTRQAIAKIVGISGERVKQIENHRERGKGAIQKIRRQDNGRMYALWQDLWVE